MSEQWKGWVSWKNIILVALLIGSLSSAGADAAASTGCSTQERPMASANDLPERASLRVQASDRERLLLELTVPDFEMDEIETDGEPYLVLSAPGLDNTETPGQPRLPQMGVLVGLPPTGGWSARIVEAERQTVPLAHPLATSISAMPVNSSAEGGPVSGASLATDASFPSSIVEMGEPALLRDLRVARLGLNPFRYNPTQSELEHVRRMLVEVRFEHPAATAPALPDRWDPFLQESVINYEIARGWRGMHAATTHSVLNPPANTPGSFKVEVDADGLYRLTYADLAAAGFPVATADPRNLHLLLEGQELAIRVEGEANGQIDVGDRILFYGQAARSRYTGTNVYWLTADGTPGLRMAQRDVTPKDGFPSAPPHRATIRFEENHLYDSKYPEADGDHWYWTDLGFLQAECPAAVQTYNFDLPLLSSSAHTVTLQTSLQGYTPGTHHLAARVNGEPVGDLIWDGTSRHESSFIIQSSLVKAGQNELRLENGNCPSPPPPSPPPNGMYVNYFEVSYLADHTATADVLDFRGIAGSWQYGIGGFSSSDIVLFDVTEPASPVHLQGGNIASGYQLAFQDDTDQPHRYLAIGRHAIPAPRALYPDTPSNLVSPSNSIDYLLIGYGDFLAATQPLLDLRKSQGLRATAVDVQDVYDEFGYGLMTPQAIKDFLSHAVAQWQLPPTYVLLVGDGTIDFRDYLGNGWHSFVPAYPAKVDPWLGETASDNQLASVVGDDSLPDLHLGRLPVTSIDETEKVVAKIVQYESEPLAGTWNQQVLFAADDADFGGNFAELSDNLYHDHLPLPFTGTRVYLSKQPDEPYEYDPGDPAAMDSARAALQRQVGAGKLLVTFFGHSSTSQWALEILLHRDHVPDLRNGQRLPVVLSMTCYTAAFHHPPYAPLDERLLMEPGGGAVAAWGPTGAGVTAGHYSLAQGFFDSVFDEDLSTLGAATLAGKTSLYTQSPVAVYLIDTYALLGDPAMSLHLDIDTTSHLYLPSVMR